LNKLATQKKINDDFDNREYRLVTGGDDGHVFFWNIPYDFINEAKAYQAQVSGEKKLSNQRQLTLGKRGAGIKYLNPAHSIQNRKIPEIKPKYELFLSGYAQIQNLILSNEYLVALDNDNTVSVLKCTIVKP